MKRGIFLEKIMHTFTPLLWTMLSVLAAFTVVLLDIVKTDLDRAVDIRKDKLRDKLHFSMTQSRGAM